MNQIMRFLETVSVILMYIAGGFIVVMLLMTVADVTMKYVTGRPISGTLEIISYYCLVGSIFLALPYLAFKNEHISSDIVYGLLTERKKRALDIFGALTSLLFFGLFTFYMWDEAIRSFSIREQAFGSVFIPLWPSKMMLPIGLTMSFVVFLAILRRRGSSNEFLTMKNSV